LNFDTKRFFDLFEYLQPAEKTNEGKSRTPKGAHYVVINRKTYEITVAPEEFYRTLMNNVGEQFIYFVQSKEPILERFRKTGYLTFSQACQIFQTFFKKKLWKELNELVSIQYDKFKFFNIHLLLLYTARFLHDREGDYYNTQYFHFAHWVNEQIGKFVNHGGYENESNATE